MHSLGRGRRLRSRISAGRRAGLERTVSVAGGEFTVGIGHAIVDLLLPALQRPIHANANTTSSRYIFKSLGFLSG